MKKDNGKIFLIYFVLIAFLAALAAVIVIFLPKLKKTNIVIDNNKKYIGLYADDPTYALRMDSVPQILGWFETVDGTERSDGKLAQAIDDHNFIPLITLEPGDLSLADIADGKYDEYFKTFFTRVSSGDRSKSTVLVRFAHEMEMRPAYGKAWYSWQSEDYKTYIKAWRHVVEMGRQQAPNIKWVWSPNRADDYTYPYYPGSEYVDYVSLSLNDNYEKYDNFEDFYTNVGAKRYLESYNKPIIISECAVSRDDSDAKKAYLQSIFDYFFTDNNIVGIVMFDENTEADRLFEFTSNKEQLKLFTDAVAKAEEKYHNE